MIANIAITLHQLQQKSIHLSKSKPNVLSPFCFNHSDQDICIFYLCSAPPSLMQQDVSESRSTFNMPPLRITRYLIEFIYAELRTVRPLISQFLHQPKASIPRASQFSGYLQRILFSLVQTWLRCNICLILLPGIIFLINAKTGSICLPTINYSILICLNDFT